MLNVMQNNIKPINIKQFKLQSFFFLDNLLYFFLCINNIITSKCVECIFIYQAYWQLIMSYHAIQHNTVWNIVDRGKFKWVVKNIAMHTYRYRCMQPTWATTASNEEALHIFFLFNLFYLKSVIQYLEVCEIRNSLQTVH